MSSTLQDEVTTLLQNNYITLILLVGIGYDYILTFSDEVEYIWMRPWGRVSTLFMLVRYCGIYNVISVAIGIFLYFWEVAFYLALSWCQMLTITGTWALFFFVAAAELVATLRVWAMYHRSRLVLVTLLVLFFLETAAFIIIAVIGSLPKNIQTVSINQISNFSVCGMEPIAMTSIYTEVTIIFQIVHSAAICILGIAQFVRQALQMYRWTKQWQLSRYMKLLVNQGTVYFIALLLFNAVNMNIVLPSSSPDSPGGASYIIQGVSGTLPLFILAPRFIMNMREVYARDIRRGDNTDTAFGMSYSEGAANEDIVFADNEQPEVEEMEEIREPEAELGIAQPS